MLQSPGLIHFMPMVVEVWEGSCPRSLGSDQSDEGKCRTAFVRKEFSEASSWGGHFCPEVQEDDRQDKAAGETEEEASGWDFWSAGAPCPAFHGGREGEPGCLSWVRLVSGTNRAFAVYPHSADGAGCPGSRQATLAGRARREEGEGSGHEFWVGGGAPPPHLLECGLPPRLPPPLTSDPSEALSGPGMAGTTAPSWPPTSRMGSLPHCFLRISLRSPCNPSFPFSLLITH